MIIYAVIGGTRKILRPVIAAVLISLSLLSPAEAHKNKAPFITPAPSIGSQRQGREHGQWITQRRKAASESDDRVYERLSPEEKETLKGKSRKWEGLSKEKRRELERRMERWQRLSAEEKDLIRKRHHQWRELTVEEQEGIREKLDRWDTLTLQEKEEVRHKFKGP
ncbi:MAG: DUF3106 domain-containing protein [Deltaproteobacteria bacterium]|nr:DUF3106 domain-containing protein [Deltaproteobacteria bacterium]